MFKLAVTVRVLAVSVVACACFTAQAQVYKWIDASGVTHYSEKPPENTKSKEVQLRNSAPAPAPVLPKDQKDAKDAKDAKDDRALTLQERERAFRQRQIVREQAEAKQARDRTEREAECKKMSVNLNDMRRTPVIYDLNDKGERVYKSDKQREEWLTAQQQEYDQKCK